MKRPNKGLQYIVCLYTHQLAITETEYIRHLIKLKFTEKQTMDIIIHQLYTND